LFLWTSKNSNKHLFYWLESCPYIKKLKGIPQLVKSITIEVILDLVKNFLKKLNMENVNLKLILKIKLFIQELK
jgi:hypothetical protein